MLLARCGEQLGVAPQDVTLTAVRRLMSAGDGELAMARSAELQGPARRAAARAHDQPRTDADRARLPRPPDGNALPRRHARLRPPRLVDLDRPPASRGRSPRPRPASLSDARSDPSGTSDRPHRAARRAAGDGRHGEQHRQREHRRLLARDGRPAAHPADRNPGDLGADRRRRAPRHGRQRRDDHAHPQHLPRQPVPHAEQRAELCLDAGRRARPGAGRVQRTVRAPGSRPSCRRSGARGPASPTRPRAKRPRRASWRPASSSRARSTSSARSCRRSPTQATEQYEARAGAGGEVESYAKQIAQLNGQIRLAEESGQQPNEMLDRRDLLLDKLSSLAQVTVTKQPDGTDTVTFGGAAKPLVEGTTVNWPQALTAALRRPARGAAHTDESGGRARELPGRRSTRSPRRSPRASTRCTRARRSSPAKPRPLWPSRSTPAQVQASSTEAAGGNDVALAIAACGAAGPTRPTRRSSSASAATSRARRTNRPTCRRRSRRSTTSVRASRACRWMKK